MNRDNIKCIFLDIDGTVDNSERVTTDYTKEVLSKLKDYNINAVICSGRTVSYAVDKSLSAGCSSYVIADNGSIVYDYGKKKIVFESIFDRELMKTINDICKKYRVECLFNTIEESYRCNDYNYHKFKRGKDIPGLDYIKANVTQIIISTTDLEDIKKAKDEILKLGNIQVSNTNIDKVLEGSRTYYCDLNIKGNSKGKGIKELIKYLNIDISNTMCFGDSLNDLSMFETCHYKIAMKNASDDLKTRATSITEYDNDHDGVAKYIEENIL